MNFNNDNGIILGNLTSDACDLDNINQVTRFQFFSTVTSSTISDLLNLITGFFVDGKKYVINLESEVDHNLFINTGALTYKTKKFSFQLTYNNPNNANYLVEMPTGNLLVKCFLIAE